MTAKLPKNEMQRDCLNTMTISRYIIILFVLCMPLCLRAQSEQFSEYEVKAAYLEKFTRFIEWPEESAIDNSKQRFILGVIGENSFESILDSMYSEQRIKGKKVEIRYISTLDKIDGCHLLFISKSEKYKLSKILTVARNKHILTVGDGKEYSQSGVLITLFVETNHVLFQIDQNAAQQSGLRINTLLLNLSRTIDTEENR